MYDIWIYTDNNVHYSNESKRKQMIIARTTTISTTIP